jgi:site-specific recombinase XerD
MGLYPRNGIYYTEFMFDGRQIRKSTRCKTIGKAQTFETNLRIKLAKQSRVVRMAGGKVPLLKDLAAEFLEEIEKGVKAGTYDHDTLRCYKNGCRLLSAHDIWDMRIDDITRGVAFGLKFPGGPSTARNAQGTLSRLLKWAASEERGYIGTAPSIKRTKYKGRLVRISQDVQAKLLAHMELDCAHIFQLELDAFMRPHEIMAIAWADVHLDAAEPYIYVPKGKSENSERDLPLSERAIAILTERKKTAKGLWVFPSRIKSKGHRVTIAKQWRAACKAAGVKGIQLYDGKRECGSSFIEEGGDLVTAQAAYGHADISTTSKYLKGYAKKAAGVINKRNRKNGPQGVPTKLPTAKQDLHDEDSAASA